MCTNNIWFNPSVRVLILLLTFWPQGQCMPRSCHGIYVYRLGVDIASRFAFKARTNRQTDRRNWTPYHTDTACVGNDNNRVDHRPLVDVFKCESEPKLLRLWALKALIYLLYSTLLYWNNFYEFQVDIVIKMFANMAQKRWQQFSRCKIWPMRFLSMPFLFALANFIVQPWPWPWPSPRISDALVDTQAPSLLVFVCCCHVFPAEFQLPPVVRNHFSTSIVISLVGGPLEKYTQLPVESLLWYSPVTRMRYVAQLLTESPASPYVLHRNKNKVKP